MDLLTIITILIIISAAFSYLNVRIVRLPGTIGVVTVSIAVSVLILTAGKADSALAITFTDLAKNINFSKVLLDVMLGFLLFASALHFDYRKLREARAAVLILSTLGVIVSTGLFAIVFYGAAHLLHIRIPLSYCLVFGALISPTDPIAVGAVLKNSRIPPKLHTIISGESLFNDAVGLILFVIFLQIAGDPDAEVSFKAVLKLFELEVLGGVAIGLVAGYFGYRLIRSIQDFQSIFLISIALVLGISAAAHQVHASIPLAVVTAGLIIGNQTRDKRKLTNQFLNQVWHLIDEVLNTILFVLIGLQLIVIPFVSLYWHIGLISIFIALAARMASLVLPVAPVLRRVSFGNLYILTWAGLRGGISIAMALTLPPSRYKDLILSSCYMIVIFSVVIQGLTLNKVIDKVAARREKKRAPENKSSPAL